MTALNSRPWGYGTGAFALTALTATPAQCAACRGDSENELLAMYGRVAVTEFCQKSKISQCSEVPKWIAHSDYEVSAHGSGIARQQLVIFTRAAGVYFPFAIFAFDKDGWITVITRGIHVGEKTKLIETFEKEGDFAR